MDLNALAPATAQPAAVPDIQAADATPGAAVPSGTSSDATGAPETVEETEQQKAERIVQERRVREERTRRKINARFGELTETIKQQQRTIEHLASAQQRPAQNQQVGDGSPQREQFDSYDDFVEARAEWRAERKAEEVAQRRIDAISQQQREVLERFRAAQVSHTFADKVESYAQANPAFADVLESDVDVGSAGPAIMEMDDAPQIMLALHRNPKIAEQLRGASSHRQGMILGKLSAELQAKPPQVSKAPEPGSPVGGRPSASQKDPSRMSFKEFSEWRRDTIAKRR